MCAVVYTVLMIDQERGIRLLGSGLGPTDVATALGCDPSLISQWLMNDDIRARVLALRVENLQAQTLRDRKIDSIEDSLLEKLQEGIQWITKPRDILAAFQILNNAKRRGAQTTGQINLTQNIVSINLPPVAKQHYFPKLNSQGEVVQVGDQVTVTASLQQLMQNRVRKQLAQEVQEITHDGTGEAGSGSRGEESRREQAAA